jgi:hypothetical protein
MRRKTISRRDENMGGPDTAGDATRSRKKWACLYLRGGNSRLNSMKA